MRKTLETFTPGKADLLALEEDLGLLLKDFLNFEQISIYFPSGTARREKTFLEEEALLLVPLKWHGKALAMLRLDGVSQENLLTLSPYLESLLELILQRLLLERLADKDRESGLASEGRFFKFMRDELEAVRSRVDYREQREGGIPFYRLCLGMLVIRWQEEQIVIRQHDHEFARQIYDSLAGKLLASLPAEVIAAPLGKYEGRHDFGLLFNASGRDACMRLASNIMGGLEEESFTDTLSGRKYSPRLYAGFALYPQDMAGEDLSLPVFEQTIRLRDRAMMAAKMAREMQGNSLEERIMSFANVARKAGRILDYTQRNRIRINLGKAANIHDGTRFLVWGKRREDGADFLKGQITVLKTGNTESIAEIFYLNRADCAPQRGDRLTLPSPWHNLEPGGEDAALAEEHRGDGSGLLSHADFLELYPEIASGQKFFILAIIRLSGGVEDNKEAIQEIYNKFLYLYKESSAEGESLAAVYGADRIIIFLPDMDAGKGKELFDNFFSRVEGLKACGLAQYPYLDFSRADIEENALKALEYGELLPEPHIGVFDSMAITIAADKKYSTGDDFSAIDEYKKALLADPANALARNSLAVCIAALGKSEEAKKIWLECLEWPMKEELKAKVCYNLGTVCQKAGQIDEAFQWYRASIKSFQHYVYAWLRIGQLSEKKGRRGSAKRYYLCAANLSEADSYVFSIARRYLARLDLNGNEAAQARTKLHELLLENPYDTASMNILAELYLQERGGALISEMLARKSLQIRDNEQAWRILARSLELLGKLAEAEKALERAEKRVQSGR